VGYCNCRNALSHWGVRRSRKPELRLTIETLTPRLFRVCVQFCSGLVDLVVCVRRHGGGGHFRTLAGERSVSLFSEDMAKVRDRCVDFGERRGSQGTDRETGKGDRWFVVS
jgi:hypothetical protein